MENMIQRYQVGMVRVEVGMFQTDCLGFPQAILQYLEYQLPHQAYRRASRMASDIKVRYCPGSGCGQEVGVISR